MIINENIILPKWNKFIRLCAPKNKPKKCYDSCGKIRKNIERTIFRFINMKTVSLRNISYLHNRLLVTYEKQVSKEFHCTEMGTQIVTQRPSEYKLDDSKDLG